MKRTQISHTLATLTVIMGLSGCGLFAASTTVVPSSPSLRSIVIQYSGGKEIGRWFLDKQPKYFIERGSSWCEFKSGDTTFTLSGDLRILSLPSPDDAMAK